MLNSFIDLQFSLNARLRRKLEKSGLEIRTVRGLGYLLRQI